jgi:hypothetical protein
MTQFDMQQIVIDTMHEKLEDTIDLRQRISIGFGLWFSSLIAPPPAPEGGGGGAPPPAPEGGGGGAPPPAPEGGA